MNFPGVVRDDIGGLFWSSGCVVFKWSRRRDVAMGGWDVVRWLAGRQMGAAGIHARSVSDEISDEVNGARIQGSAYTCRL